MKALYFGGERPVYEERCKPVPSPSESLIRILMSGICNTDKEVMKGYRPEFRGVMGHEFIGIVEESSDPRWIGKRVAGELNAGCQTCLYCKTGREKHCLNRRVIGMENKDGCFAEYMTLETHLLHEVPEDLPTETAIFAEPLAAALQIPEQVHIQPDTSVAIIGDGRLGFMIAGVLSLHGVDLTIIGRHDEKLKAFEAYGKTCKETTDTFEVVVDATGSFSGFELASTLVRKQGTIVLKSTYAGKTMVDMSYFVVNEITIVGSRCGPFEPALRLLEKGLIKLPPIQLYSLDCYEDAFRSNAFKTGFLIGKE